VSVFIKLSVIQYIPTAIKITKIIFQRIALPGPPCPLYLFFLKKDAAAIANSAMRENKVRRFRLLTPFSRPAQAPAASGLPRRPHAVLLGNPSARIAAGTCFPLIILLYPNFTEL